MANTDTELIKELLAFIAQSSSTPDEFNSLALKLFAYQFEYNLALQRYCLARGKTPRTVKSWREIPAVPINAFKDLTLSCIPPEQAQRVFMTSGTTRGEVKGRHYHLTLQVYDASMLTYFRQRYMSGVNKIRMGILFPDEDQLPNSSLAHYLALAVREFGAPGSGYFLGPQGLDVERLIRELEQVQKSGEPFALLGASYSFVHLLDELQRRGLSFQLPAGSRVLDTGGFKGQSREMAQEDFYQQLSYALGVPRSLCINMYGMTELSTQMYDNGNDVLPDVKSGPNWMASRVVDPLTQADVPAGERGILVHCDLANFNSVTTILTEDVGVMVDGGFLLLGRAQGSQAKGCSLMVEEFLRTATA
jgi:hypothetical protein